MKKQFLQPCFTFFLLIITVLSACQKQEALMKFPDKIKPPPPVTPPPVDPPPLSEDLKNIQFLFNDQQISTSIIARKIFSDIKQPSGSYANGFELIIRLDDNAEEIGFQQLQIKLPLNETGQVVKGKYTIHNNQVVEGGNSDIVYTKGRFSEVFPDATFSADQSKYNFNLSLRIEDFDVTDHSIAGVIDSVRIELITDTSKHITIKNGGFHFFYDYLELSIDDVLAYETTTGPYSTWYPRDAGSGVKFMGISGEKLYSVSGSVPFKQAVLTFGLAFSELQETFTGETTLPVPTENSFVVSPEEYTELEGKPFFGILPAGSYTCRFTKSPGIGVAGGMEVSFDNGKRLLGEYYDYEADPVWGVYHPQEFKEGVVYKMKCTFYQKRL